jgi:hypothetical protein
MVSVPLQPAKPLFRLHLSGVVRAEALRPRLQPLQQAPPPRRVVLTCDDDVRVRPKAIGLLYQIFLQMLTNGPTGEVDLVVIAGAPSPLSRTLHGLVDKVSSSTRVVFLDRPSDVSSLLVRHTLHTLLPVAVPFRATSLENLRERIPAVNAPTLLSDAA